VLILNEVKLSMLYVMLLPIFCLFSLSQYLSPGMWIVGAVLAQKSTLCFRINKRGMLSLPFKSFL
jgi:hypothetical protein